jgi:hypothetical protein
VGGSQAAGSRVEPNFPATGEAETMEGVTSVPKAATALKNCRKNSFAQTRGRTGFVPILCQTAPDMTTEPANSAAHRITGPHPAGDLAVYLVHGLDRCDAHQFDTLADANPEAGAQPTEPHLTPGSVSAWLQEAISGELLEQQHIAPRLRFESRRSRDQYATYFGSVDEESGVLLHQN